MKNIQKKEFIGVGALLKINNGKYLFQKRDKAANVNKEKIAPFGGGMKRGEDFISAVRREIKEELNLDLSPQNLKEIGDFKSHVYKDKYIKMFFSEIYNISEIEIHEGEGVLELSFNEAQKNSSVTEFTKEVIKYFLEKNY